MSKTRIGRFGALVLLAVSRLGSDEAIGVNIWHKVEDLDGDRVASGSVYRTLKDLQQKGLLYAEERPVIKETRMHYQLTKIGIEYLDGYKSKIHVLARELDAALVA